MSKGARKHESHETNTVQATIPAPSDAADLPITKTDLITLDEPDGNVAVGYVPQERPERPERPTTVPDYDVEALAAASFHNAKQKVHLPLDLSVPVRKERASVCGAPLRAAFLLSHVDDRMTIAEIAESAQIPIADAIENFTLLSDLGVVELRGAGGSDGSSARPGTQSPNPPAMTPKSGLRPKS